MATPTTTADPPRPRAGTAAGGLRIFHGPENVAGVPALLARAQRNLGHRARAGVFPHEFEYTMDDVIAMSRRPGVRALRAARLAASFDIFQIYFGQSLLGPRLNDVRLLRKLGKKVVFYFCGCDIRDEKATIMTYAISACRECFPKLCAPNRDRARRFAAEHSDANFVSTPDLLEFVEGATLVPQPYDVDRIDDVLRAPPPARDRERFVVVHAPTNTNIKGTRFLDAAVAQLRAEGVPIELTVLRDLSHAEVLQAARGADLAVDQLLVGSYGVFAVEMMALGVPVAVYIRDDLVGKYPAPPPVQNVSPETVVDVLRAAVEGRLPLQERAADAEQYVREFHHPERIARLCLGLYG